MNISVHQDIGLLRKGSADHKQKWQSAQKGKYKQYHIRQSIKKPSVRSSRTLFIFWFASHS